MKTSYLIILCCAVLLFAIFVWPTIYQYQLTPYGLMRITRATGHTEVVEAMQTGIDWVKGAISVVTESRNKGFSDQEILDFLTKDHSDLEIIDFLAGKHSKLDEAWTIEEFRKAYPQYNDLSDNQLADVLYSKWYPNTPRKDFDRHFLGRKTPGASTESEHGPWEKYAPSKE
jgi:hypothetical protein